MILDMLQRAVVHCARRLLAAAVALEMLFSLTAMADEPLRVRVLTYNIHHGEGVDRRIDLERVASVIRNARPDLAAVQEVDRNTKRSGGIDQAAELARLTGMHFAFGANLDFEGGEYGNLVLSRWPILHSQNRRLPATGGGEQRGVLAVETIIPSANAWLYLLATHLDARPVDHDRLASAEAINALMATYADHPGILAGDLNDSPGSPAVAHIEQQWLAASSSEQATFPAGAPARQLDYLFAHPRQVWKIIETQVLEEDVASDHRPLLAVLELSPPRRLPRNQLLEAPAAGEAPESQSALELWAKRRESVVRGMQDVTGRLPGDEKRSPLDVQVVSEVDRGTYVLRLVTYASEPNCRTPAYLAIPKKLLAAGGKETAPAVLCLHGTDNEVGHGVVVGLGGRPNRQYASELAERGYVALAPNYPLLAKYQPDLDTLGWRSGTLKAVWDNMRAVDLLSSLPYVSPGKIGAIGHSLGGHNAVYTGVFDERISAIVTSCGLDSYLDYMAGDAKVWAPEKGWTQTRYMPRLTAYQGRLEQIPFDFHELIAALAPRHVMIIAPTRDHNFQAASVDRIAQVAGLVFELFGAADRLIVKHPDCDHDFPREMREEAYRLFDRVFSVPGSAPAAKGGG